MTVMAMSLTAVNAQILQSQLKNYSDEQLLREWIKVLASDEFGGRKPMTTYEDKTVTYLARQLEEIGLEPAFGNSWFQPFSMIAVTAKPVGNKLLVRGGKRPSCTIPTMQWYGQPVLRKGSICDRQSTFSVASASTLQSMDGTIMKELT